MIEEELSFSGFADEVSADGALGSWVASVSVAKLVVLVLLVFVVDSEDEEVLADDELWWENESLSSKMREFVFLDSFVRKVRD